MYFIPYNWGDRGRIAGDAEHDFQDAFKKMEALGTVHTRRGNYLKDGGGQ
jgi:hypothetical protein